MPLKLYTLADMKLINETPLPHWCRNYTGQMVCTGHIESMAFSPDNKLLAVGQESRPRPRLFDLTSRNEVFPYEGHNSYVVDLRFSANGRILRSIGSDGNTCTWDAGTMKMLTRKSLPTGRFLANIRPSDGRYGVCPVRDDPNQPTLVVDLETGKTVCEVMLPLKWDQYMTRMYWLDESMALALGEGHWRRFNYQTGTIVAEGTIDIDKQNSLYNGCGELTEDGKSLFYAHDAGKASPPWDVEVTDVATLRGHELGEIRPEQWPNGPVGLVPGGRHFHLGTQIYDRQTLKPVAAREFPHMRVAGMTFSAAGDRYAVVMWKSQDEDDHNGWRHRDAASESLVRVHETLSGGTLLAFAPAHAAGSMVFSPDGRRLAVAYDDGTIEIRDLPVKPTK